MRVLWLLAAALTACGRIGFDPLGTGGVTGDGPAVGPPCTVGTPQLLSTGSRSQRPHMVWTGTNYAVTWSEGLDVFSILIDAAGMPVSGAVNVSVSPANDSQMSTIAWTGSELAIQLRIETPRIKPTGYELLLFYP